MGHRKTRGRWCNVIEWQLHFFLAGEDLNIKFSRRPVCTGKHVTQQISESIIQSKNSMGYFLSRQYY